MTCEEFTLYRHDVAIGAILSPTASSASYDDIDHLDDRLAGSGAVRGYRVVGDTAGDDPGTRTSVTVDFNPIRFEEE